MCVVTGMSRRLTVYHGYLAADDCDVSYPDIYPIKAWQHNIHISFKRIAFHKHTTTMTLSVPFPLIPYIQKYCKYHFHVASIGSTHIHETTYKPLKLVRENCLIMPNVGSPISYRPCGLCHVMHWPLIWVNKSYTDWGGFLALVRLWIDGI